MIQDVVEFGTGSTMLSIQEMGMPCHHMRRVMLDDTAQSAREPATKAASAQDVQLPMHATVTDNESLARLDRVLASSSGWLRLLTRRLGKVLPCRTSRTAKRMWPPS